MGEHIEESGHVIMRVSVLIRSHHVIMSCECIDMIWSCDYEG